MNIASRRESERVLTHEYYLYTPRINSFYVKINTITIDRASPSEAAVCWSLELIYQPWKGWVRYYLITHKETTFLYFKNIILFLCFFSDSPNLWKDSLCKVFYSVTQSNFTHVLESLTFEHFIQLIFLQHFNPVKASTDLLSGDVVKMWESV